MSKRDLLKALWAGLQLEYAELHLLINTETGYYQEVRSGYQDVPKNHQINTFKYSYRVKKCNATV